MSGSLGHLNILLSMDNREFTDNLYKATKDVKKFSQQSQSEFQRIQNSLDHLCDVGKRFNHVFTFAKVAGAATAFVRLSDSYTNLSNRIKLVTDNSAQQAAAMKDVYDIALKTFQSSEATAQVYSKFAQSAKDLGLAQSDVARLTETVNKAINLSGVSAASAQAGLLQFSQALDKGKLSGQELTSVMTQTPALARAIADGLDVPIGALKEMGENGELTTETVIKALQKMGVVIDHKFASTATTVDNAWTNLGTAVEKYVGETDQAIGATQFLVKGLSFATENVDLLAKSFVALGASATLYKVGKNLHHLGVDKLAQKQALETQKLAEQAARDQAAALAQSTSAQLTNARAIFETSQQELAAIATKQQAILAERQQLALQAQASVSYSERKAIQIEIAALDAKQIALEQQKSLVTTQNIAARQALSLAYRENAVAQSAANVGMMASTAQMGVFRTMTTAVTAELQIMKTAVMTNPILMGISILATLGTMAYSWLSVGEATEEASAKAGEYLKTVDTSREALIQMSVAALNVEKDKLEESKVKFEKTVDEKKRKLAELKDALSRAEKGIIDTADAWYTYQTASERQADLTKEIHQATLDYETSLAQASEAGSKLSTIQNEINARLGKGSEAVPDVSNKVLVFSGSLDEVAKSAESARQSVADFLGTLFGKGAQLVTKGNQIEVYADEKFGNELAKMEQKAKIAGLTGKKRWEEEGKLRFREGGFGDLKTVMIGGKEVGAEQVYVDRYVQQQAAEEADRERKKAARGGSKGKKGKKEKKDKKTDVDYKKQLTDQLTQMQSNLAQLQTDAKDISLFGQPSQYQEINKLTQDIANNAEKYKHYGVEGVEKLKAMANQLNAAQQEVVIGQFKFGQNEKLDAMEFELSLSGKSRQEQELLQYNHQLDLEAAKLKIGMSKENAANLDIEIAKLKERYAQLQKERQLQQADPVAGIKAGIAQFGDEAQNVMGNVANITGNALNGMSNALTDFVTTGKADFRGLAQSIIKDISAMIVKMMIFKAIQAGMNAMGFGGFAEGGAVGGYAHGGLVGFDGGGFTGVGGKYQPAGIVHKGEYVLTKEATSRIGVDYLNYLNYGNRRGFASGGGVAVPRLPQSHFQPGTRSPNVSVKVINNGQPMEAEISTKQQGDQMEITVALMKQIARQEASNAIQQNFRAGGAFA